MEFEIRTKVLNIGDRKGQTVYYAQLKSQERMTLEQVINRVVRETSLSAGDVMNVLISLNNVVCDCVELGSVVELGNMGTLRTVVTSKMMNTPEEVTVADALNNAKLQYYPSQMMRNALKNISMSIDRSRVISSSTGGSDTGGGTPGTGDGGDGL